MSDKLGTEVANSKEVICPFNQLSVLLVENWQAVGTQRRYRIY